DAALWCPENSCQMIFREFIFRAAFDLDAWQASRARLCFVKSFWSAFSVLTTQPRVPALAQYIPCRQFQAPGSAPLFQGAERPQLHSWRQSFPPRLLMRALLWPEYWHRRDESLP